MVNGQDTERRQELRCGVESSGPGGLSLTAVVISACPLLGCSPQTFAAALKTRCPGSCHLPASSSAAASENVYTLLGKSVLVKSN